MTLPATLRTANDEAILPLFDDDGAAARPNAPLGIGSAALYGDRVARLGVASHLAGDAASGAAPVILIAGSDGSVVRTLAVNANGQLVDAHTLIDNTGFVDGTTRVGMAGFIYDEAAGTAVSENDAVAARTDIKRAQVMVIEDADNRGLSRRATVTTDKELLVKGVKQAALTNRSGTIATGGTRQQMMAANAARRYLFIQNTDAAEDLWFNFTTNAVQDQPSIRLGPWEKFIMEGEFVSTELVDVIATTSGHKFTAKEG